MEGIKRPKAEYGGFLPLELNPGEEYFAQYEDYLFRFNSVKAALDALIRELDIEEIFIPYYYCPSTTEAIRETGVSITFYHISDDLMPNEVPDNDNTAVILVDYFGVLGDSVTNLAKSFKNAEIIIDRAHAFYEDPVIHEHIHNVYSAKKFFGIPDGAYIVTKTSLTIETEESAAFEYAGYLINAYEKGTDSAYHMKKDADKFLKYHYHSMSALSLGLLKNADYERVRDRRKQNYRVLYDLLNNINELDIPQECPAYLFPLLISGKGNEIKKRLVNEKIFVPTLWAGDDLIANGNEFELRMKDDTIFLPIDQRYDRDDMKYIAGLVKEIIGDITRENT